MQQENLFTPDCIRTFSGQYVNIIDPDPATLLIEDIAHGLAGQLRFGGQSPIRYTVAQHCVECARHTEGDKFEALMHDSPEAYLGDMPSPIKSHLPDYQALEKKFATMLSKKFNFNYPYHSLTKLVDIDELKWEWDAVMLAGTHPPNIIHFVDVWSADRAKEEFLKMFYELSALREENTIWVEGNKNMP